MQHNGIHFKWSTGSYHNLTRWNGAVTHPDYTDSVPGKAMLPIHFRVNFELYFFHIPDTLLEGIEEVLYSAGE